jgi:hypothetical protein
MTRSATSLVLALSLAAIVTAVAIAHGTERAGILSDREMIETGGATSKCDCDWKLLYCDESPICFGLAQGSCTGQAGGTCCYPDQQHLWDGCGSGTKWYIVGAITDFVDCGRIKSNTNCTWSMTQNKCLCVGFPSSDPCSLPLLEVYDNCIPP